MFCTIPFFDDVKALQQAIITFPLIGHIALSCLFAFGVNVSNYLVLGRTSPLTYQVLGHMRMNLIFSFGFLFFSQKYNMKILSGIFIALVGVILYTEFKRHGIGNIGNDTKREEYNLKKSSNCSVETQIPKITSEENLTLLGEI